MKVMICLKVKYGYPVAALYGFLGTGDYEVWEQYLNGFSSEISVNYSEGLIYWIVENGDPTEKIREKLSSLPLLKEDFFDFQIHELTAFSSLDCWFDKDRKLPVKKITGKVPSI